MDIEFSDNFIQVLKNARSVVVSTGAGVSAESGVPTFRGEEGLWKKFRAEELATFEAFNANPELVWEWYQFRRDIISKIKPNPGHYAIAEMAKLFDEFHLITQNIDNLHQKAGVPEDKVFELHGNMKWAVCLSCSRRFPMPEVLQKIKGGIEVPDCPDCQGILKPGAVLFGEALPQETLLEATRRSQNCDLFIVIGSTLIIYPAAYMPTYARDAGARLAIVNLNPTPLDQYATVVIQGEAGQIMPKVMEKVRLS